MPRDKSITNAKIIKYMKEEFLTYGYEKASLNRISAEIGITTAALYKHFKNKEDMFFFLVKDTIEDFERLNSSGQNNMRTNMEYNPFDKEYTERLVDFIYDHYEGVKLLICCSKGSAYESFEDDLIEKEAESNKEYAEILKASGKMNDSLSEMEWHLLSTAYIHLVLEVVRHDMTKDEAYKHMSFVCRLLYPGWKKLLGIEM